MKKIFLMLSLLVSCVIVVGCSGSQPELPTGVDNVLGEKTLEDTTERNSTAYISYTRESFDQLQQTEKSALVFFHASRCGSCSALDKNISKDIDALDDSIVILKADFDSEIDLKKVYGVNSPHTIVVSKAGSDEFELKKGVFSVDQINSFVK